MDKKVLFALTAILAVFLVGFAAASDLVVSTPTIEVNSIVVDSSVTVAGEVDDVIPVRISFEAKDNADDVRVKVWMEGYRNDVEASTSRFDLVDGSSYSKLLSLAIQDDMKDTT